MTSGPLFGQPPAHWRKAPWTTASSPPPSISPAIKSPEPWASVRGIVVRSRSVVGNIGASFQTLFGGNITILTDLCERARMDAYNQMAEHATALGANGVVGVRYDANEIMPGVTEVLCYGTAVVVQSAT